MDNDHYRKSSKENFLQKVNSSEMMSNYNLNNMSGRQSSSYQSHSSANHGSMVIDVTKLN